MAALRWMEVTIRRAGRQATARYARYTQEQLSDPSDMDVFASTVEHPEDDLDVWRALRTLTEDERQVLFLSVVADWPQKRIAAYLGVSQPRVSQLRGQALQHMRDLLEEGRGRYGQMAKQRSRTDKSHSCCGQR